MFSKENRANTIHGILLIALFSFAAFYIAEIPFVKSLSFSPLIVGIILGMLYANSLRNKLPETWVPGIKFCTKQILRAGIVLYGFRLTLTQVAAVGLPAVVIDTIIVAGTIFLGVWLGKLLKMDKDTSLMTATGSAICGAAAVLEQGRDRWIEALSAALPSDFSIPVTKATTQDPGESIALAHAAEETMCGEFAESMPEITRIKVLDHGDLAEAVVPDVRPVRAVILAAVLSLFFVVVIFLLWELSRDGIWLPATLRRRYGLHSLGTVESTGFAENVKYLLEKADAHKIAVCGALPEGDPQEAVDRLRELQPAGREQTSGRVQPIDREWIAVPSPLLCPESAETLRAADVVLLAVPAGATVGKRLEAVLEYLTAQDCKVDGAFLWNADETLIRSYYFLPMIGSDTADNDMNTRNTEMEHTKTTQAEGEQA